MASKAKRELDAARKAGVLPPEQDAKTGELINPHIPEFMAKAPWYLSQGSAPTLAHQRKEEAQRAGGFAFESFHKRGEFAGQATVFRKGACKNCGSMTHKERDCVERPRAVGAWKSGRDIAPDEVLPGALASDWDTKRDRWAGYDPAAHDETVARYEAAEAERARIRAEQKAAEAAAAAAAKAARHAAREERRAAKRAARADAQRRTAGAASAAGSELTNAAAPAPSDAGSVAHAQPPPRPDDDAATASEAGSVGDEDEESSDDGDGSGFSDDDDDDDGRGGGADEVDVRERDSAAPQQDVKSAGTQKKMSVRNLRVREDTAKYLHNLDTNSAYYDPKTRSLRENPFADGAVAPAGVTYRGDAAVKTSGGAADFAVDQVFAWDASEAGADGVHLQANPTQLALLKQQFAERKAALASAKVDQLRAKYGVAGGVEAIPQELRMGQGEGYVEFTRDGRVVTKEGAKLPGLPSKSRYDEDVWPGNHKSVWGSWFDRASGSWGFACCHSVVHASYCTGASGKAARVDAEKFASSAAASAAASASAVAASAADGGAGAAAAAAAAASARGSGLYGEQLAPSLDAAKLRAALERHARAEAAAAGGAGGSYGEDEEEERGRGRGGLGGGGSGGGGGGGARRGHHKRGYNSLAGDADAGGTGAEDIEVYQLKRIRAGDPMALLAAAGGGLDDGLLPLEQGGPGSSAAAAAGAKPAVTAAAREGEGEEDDER